MVNLDDCNINNEIILYHLSTSQELITEFTPRKPSRSKREETKDPRLSLSDTISGCIYGIGQPRVINISREFKFLILYTFVFDKDCDYLVYPEEVAERFIVSDAIENHEYCYIGPSVRPASVDFINVTEDLKISYLEDIKFPLEFYLVLKNQNLYLTLEDALSNLDESEDAVIKVNRIDFLTDEVEEQIIEESQENSGDYFKYSNVIIPEKGHYFKFMHYLGGATDTFKITKLYSSGLVQNLYSDDIIFQVTENDIIKNNYKKQIYLHRTSDIAVLSNLISANPLD